MSILFLSKDLISTGATFVMDDANAMVGPLQGRRTRLLEKTTIGMYMALELKK